MYFKHACVRTRTCVRAGGQASRWVHGWMTSGLLNVQRSHIDGRVRAARCFGRSEHSAGPARLPLERSPGHITQSPGARLSQLCRAKSRAQHPVSTYRATEATLPGRLSKMLQKRCCCASGKVQIKHACRLHLTPHFLFTPLYICLV